MLLAARESAVTKNPRLRLTMRRSSSVRPLGSFHRAMSRVMLTSCGIQWLAQLDRYFSQAHLYLKGTNWLTSVLPLMMRLSAALTRRAVPAAGALADAIGRGKADKAVGVIDASASIADGLEKCSAISRSDRLGEGGKLAVGVTSSSQDNIVISNSWIMRSSVK